MSRGSTPFFTSDCADHQGHQWVTRAGRQLLMENHTIRDPCFCWDGQTAPSKENI